MNDHGKPPFWEGWLDTRLGGSFVWPAHITPAHISQPRGCSSQVQIARIGGGPPKGDFCSDAFGMILDSMRLTMLALGLQRQGRGQVWYRDAN